MEDFYHKKIKITSQEELYELYILYSDQWVEHTRQKISGKPKIGRDSFLDWILKVGICPHGVITANSRYWIELINICDGEMGVTLPFSVTETPDIFFQALGIVRGERAEIRAEEEKLGSKKNSNRNQGYGSAKR